MAIHLWDSAGWTMIHFFWIGGLIFLVASAGRRLLRSASPDVRYLFLLGCLLACLAAPVLIGWRMLGTPTVPAVSLSAAPSQPLPSPPDMREPARRTASPGVPRVEPAVTLLPAGRGITRLLEGLALHLPWVWFLGSPLTFAWLVVGLCGAHRLSRRSQVPEDRALLDLLRRLEASLGLAGRVALRTCDRIASPVLLGILRPVVLLPPALVSGCSVEQVEMVLLHELAHVRRWDNLVNLIQRIVESLLFFHPGVWWVSRWIRIERERACDDLVLARTRNPRLYAETLAALALPSGSLAVAAALSGNDTVGRLRRILKPEPRSLKVSRVWVLTLLLLGFICLIPFLAVLVLQTPSATGSESPYAFLRYSPGEESGGTLQTALAVYLGPEVEVFLLTEFPFAEANYYQKVEALLADRQAVLHSGPGVADDDRPGGWAERVRQLAQALEIWATWSLLGLGSEVSAIDRRDEKFIPVSEETESAVAEEAPEESQLDRLLRWARNDVNHFLGYARKKWEGIRGGEEPSGEEAPDLRDPQPKTGNLKSLVARETVVLWEAAWPAARPAPEGAQDDGDGPEERRNRMILEKLRELMRSGTERVALYFPPGRLSELEALLARESGFEGVKKEWLIAWDAAE